MDSLSQILQELRFNAEVFFSGKLCGLHAFEEDRSGGVLHFVRSGSATFLGEQDQRITLAPSSVIFIPEGMKHQLNVTEAQDLEVVCASIKMSEHQRLALTDHLPRFLYVDVEKDRDLSEIARRIFDEGFHNRHGRQIMIDRLCDMFIVQLLRYVIDNGVVDLGNLSGSAHPRLSQLMDDIRDKPAHAWSVEEMARQTAMSRSRFAEEFKETVGLAPMEFVTELRLNTAKTLLRKQLPVNLVANEVGYDNASSLARVFKKRFGVAPKQWVSRQ